MKRYALIAFLLSAFVGGPALAQPKILWQKCYGGSGFDQSRAMVQTTDGGFAFAGGTTSTDGDVSGNHGGEDAWLVKLNASGAIQWQKSYGGSSDEFFVSVVKTADGGFAMVGQTSSTDGQVLGYHGGVYDAWVVKVDNAGVLQWQKCLGGTSADLAQSIIQTSDGGYAVAGQTSSNDGDVSGNHGAFDAWVVKLSSAGAIEWQKCYGGSNDDDAASILQTSDGGFTFTGVTESNDGDVSGNHGGATNIDAWLVKINSTGAIEWQKCLGGTGADNTNSIIQTSDGGFAIAGETTSNDGDVSGNHGNGDTWVLKLNSAGVIQWQKCLGGTGSDEAYSIVQTSEGGFAIAGNTFSNNDDVSGNRGGGDAWVVKLNSTCSIQWQKCLGGTKTDLANSIVQTTDGGFVFAGYTYSNDSDASGNHGQGDAWVVRLGTPPPPPTISYITPDAGAPGMCVAVEIVAPASASGDFGGDQEYRPDTLVRLTRASDSSLVRLGPSVVSWNGRLIQQMFMIEPNIKSLDTEVYFQVVVNGVGSATDSFEIKAPFDFGTQSGGGVLLGASRTKRNTMVVDSMTLENGTFTLPTTDPDASTPGNQAYLPLRILSVGPIHLINATINASGSSGVTGTGGGAGATGGGGGGSGYPGAGGAGYTGGGGDNGNSNGSGGTGTGSTSSSPTGGQSLNGVAGGNGETENGGGGDDGGGGGTALPFGTSGTNGGPSSSPSGGFGAGSAGGSSGPPFYSTNYGGGGGGFESAGGAGGGTGNNAGQANGNSTLVPLAGGSGGGAGNATYSILSPNAQGGCGGGGGGSIELTSFASFSLSSNSITANGGNGSNANSSAAGGGGGSGGAVSIGARDSIVISSTASISENGGSGGSGQNNGGTGGLGRTRLNGMVSKFASPSSANYFSTGKDFTGPSIQRVTPKPDSVYVQGYAEQWDNFTPNLLPIEVHWAWPSSPIWHDTLVNLTPDPKSHTALWSAVFPNSVNPSDSEVYVVAVQDESGGSSTFADIPAGVMSHTSGIIAKIALPKMLVKVTTLDFGNVLLDSCSHDTTIEIYSTGRADLIVDSVALNPAIPDFKIKTIFPDTLHSGDSLPLTLSFCPTAVKCPIAANVQIYSNGGDTIVALTGCGVQPSMMIHPLVIDFGRVHVGDCKDTFAIVSDTGKSNLTITSESIGDPRFAALDPLPLIVPAGGSVKLNLRYCPTDTTLTQTYDTVRGDAPQSPIGLTLIGSGKIGVLSLPAVIDFGLVHLDSCKDSVIYAKNIGNDSLILESNVTLPSGFTAIVPTLPLVIPAGDSAPIDIRFCSTDTGSFEGTSIFATDIPDRDTILLLAHTGIGILSIPNTIDFGAVPTGACVDTSIFVTNIGTDTLFLGAPTNLAPPFSYLGPAPLLLAPGASDSVTFQFCPTDTIAYRESLQFDTIHPGVSPTFTLLGNGTQGALATSGAINLGCIVKGDTTVTVTIRNTGTAPLDSLTATIIPNGVATIVHNPPASLAPGVGDSVVLIIPASNYGAISGTLSIVWRGGMAVTLPITGNVTTSPAITSLDSIVTFDTTSVDSSSADTCIRITNYSCIPIAIDSAIVVGGLNGEFEIVSNSAGASLSDSAIASICVRYTPRRGGPASAELAIVSGRDTVSVAALSGVGVGKAITVELAVDTVAGRPGEIVNVPVRTLDDITSAAITSLTFRVTFNPMQLDLKSPVAPVTLHIIPASIAHDAHTLSTTATYSVKTYSIGDKEITATYSSPLTGTPVVAELPFEILEPTANTASIHILSASFGTSPATLSTSSDGLIQIEQCDTNNRVIYSPAAITVAQNNPNPFSIETAVTVDVQTAGHLTLEVYNALGMKVIVPFDADVAVGTQTIPIDASTLPSGAYRYITTWTGAAIPVRIEKTMVVLGE